jgi:hypothetical protein
LMENLCMAGAHKAPVLSFIIINPTSSSNSGCKIMTLDIRTCGRQSDSGVFTESNVFRHLKALV